jgi:hypothetical protein
LQLQKQVLSKGEDMTARAANREEAVFLKFRRECMKAKSLMATDDLANGMSCKCIRKLTGDCEDIINQISGKVVLVKFKKVQGELADLEKIAGGADDGLSWKQDVVKEKKWESLLKHVDRDVGLLGRDPSGLVRGIANLVKAEHEYKEALKEFVLEPPLGHADVLGKLVIVRNLARITLTEAILFEVLMSDGFDKAEVRKQVEKQVAQVQAWGMVASDLFHPLMSKKVQDVLHFRA